MAGSARLLGSLLIGMGMGIGGATVSPAAAQEPPAVGGTESETEAPLRLSPVSVTATRNPIAAFRYPGMVTVIEREEIRRLQPSTVDDVVGRVPGVSFTGGPRRSGQMPSIRGFSGPDVVLMIDGVRQNFNSGHDGRLFLEPSLLREAEVLRGSASSLYGSGGLGGVMEFRTLRADDILGPGERYGLEASAGYRSANREWLGTTTGVARPLDNLDLVASVTHRSSGRIRLGDGTRLRNTDDDIVSGLLKGAVSFADFHRLEASALFFNNDATEPNNAQGMGGADIVDKEMRNRSFRLGYSYDNPDNRWLGLDATVYYTENLVDEERLDNLGAGPQGQELRRRVRTLGMRVENRSSFAPSDDTDLRFTYGVEGNRDRQVGRADGAVRDGVPDAEATLFGVFAQAEFDWRQPFGVLPGTLQLIPGVRWDSYRSSSDLASNNNDNAVSPRLAASYSPTPWSMVFASYGHAFRAPSFDELYASGTHFQIPIGPGIVNRFVPNPDLKPQRTRTLEIGAGLDFQDVIERGDGLHLKASRYWTRARDLIDLQVVQPSPFVTCNPFIPGNCDGTTQSVNVSRAKLSGNEVEGVYDHSRFRLSLGYADIRGRDQQTGDHLGRLFPARITADATLKLPELDGFLGWRVVRASDFTRVNNAADERDGYTTHDLYLGWVPSSGPLRGFRVDLGIDNVTDRTYARAYTGANEPGRDFKGLVSYRFTW